MSSIYRREPPASQLSQLLYSNKEFALVSNKSAVAILDDFKTRENAENLPYARKDVVVYQSRFCPASDIEQLITMTVVIATNCSKENIL